jgi:hypothetical protein
MVLAVGLTVAVVAVAALGASSLCVVGCGGIVGALTAVGGTLSVAVVALAVLLLSVATCVLGFAVLTVLLLTLRACLRCGGRALTIGLRLLVVSLASLLLTLLGSRHRCGQRPSRVSPYYNEACGDATACRGPCDGGLSPMTSTADAWDRRQGPRRNSRAEDSS